MTREPGGSPGAEAVRHVLLSGAAEPFGPKMEALLFAAARSDHVEQVIRPAVERGAIVLCDRFLDSSRVYQGVTGDLDPAFVEALEEVAINGMMPDMTLILDIDPARRPAARHGAARRRRRPDRFEKETLAIHQRRREAYLAIAAAEPERCIVIDASADPDTVENVVTAAVFAALEAHDAGAQAAGGAGMIFERIAPEQHDTLDGVPEPSETLHLFGHAQAAAMLAAAYRAGKLPHALVFAGPRRHRQGDARLPPGAPSADASGLPTTRRTRLPCPIRPHRCFARSPAARIPSVLHLTRPLNDKTKSFKTVAHRRRDPPGQPLPVADLA